MTTQEFVKHEVDKISKESTLHGAKLFSDGLTKGLEVAKEFAEWTQRNRYKQEGGKKGNGTWYVQAAGHGGGEPRIYTTSELLTIFLTEKNVK